MIGRMPFVSAIIAFAICQTAPAMAAEAEGAILASASKAKLPVVVAPTASDRVKAAASSLAEILGRMARTKFEVTTGDGLKGVAVGVAGDFPNLPFIGQSQRPRPDQREEYVIRSHPAGVCLIGATDLAVEDAVWDLLYRLGYRQFFPGPKWEVVPELDELRVAVDVSARPDYLSRRIWYGFGTTEYNAEPWRDWCMKNRCVQGIELHTGHSYQSIVSGNKEAFAAHPEWLAQIDGRRVQPSETVKLCISNAELRKFVEGWAVEQFRKRPEADSISLDPSDGGGWCECDACRRMGTPSDRVVLLANQAAEAVQKDFPGKLVCIYAYASHSPPPAVDVHPQVVVNVATAFLRGGFTLDEIIAGWSARKANMGIREYYSVYPWDHDQPAAARGGNLEYLARTIREFHRRGARYLTAESSDNWGPNGLGYYVATRLLWDTDEAKNVPALVDDFLTRAFGKAKEPMAEFYRQLDAAHKPLVPSDQLARMYGSLAQARKLTDDDAVQARLDDLVLYTRYADLYWRYAAAKGEARQAAFDAVVRHAWRMRATMMVHSKAVLRDLANRDKSVQLPDDFTKSGKYPTGPAGQPYAAAEIAALLAEGVKRYPPVEVGFEPVTYSADLVSAAPLKLANGSPGEHGPGRSEQVFETLASEPTELALEVTGGLIAHYRDRGNVRLELFAINPPTADGAAEPQLVAQDRSVPPDGKAREVRLMLPAAGRYRLKVNDGSDRTRIVQKSSLPWTIESSREQPINASYSWSLVFYVPKGTKVVGLHGGGSGQVVDSQGRVQLDLAGKPLSYHRAEVPAGEDGRLWRIHSARGSIRLLNVPPYLASTASTLLLPREVVERDK